MLFGACACFTLVMIWPQSYLINVFNSKLAYQLILDVEDYFTCDNSYVQFVVDEPDSSYSMFTFFVFNVTNCADVLQRGNKPNMLETGPYGFVKYTYKYEISFDDPVQSTTVTFKEYSTLQEITHPDACEKMYFRMDRDLLEQTPCSGDECKCKSYDSLVTVVNPLMLKTLWQDSPDQLIGHYSVDVFENIKTVLEDPFTEAVRAHLVSYALKEVFMFRTQMQLGPLITDTIHSLLLNYTLDEIANTAIAPLTCGLAKYGITNCPFKPYASLETAKKPDLNATDYPSIAPLINSTYNISLLSTDYGLPRFVMLMWHLGDVQFNTLLGYTMITTAQINEVYDLYVDTLASASFGADYSSNQLEGAKRMLAAFSNYISLFYMRDFASVLSTLVYDEYLNGYAQVPCSPLGLKCTWQWGYLKHYENNTLEVSTTLALQLVDTTTIVSTNPVSIYKDLNAPKWYNSFLYCRDVRDGNASADLSCTDLSTTFEDALISRPAGLWGKDTGISTNNLTYLWIEYAKLDDVTKLTYVNLSCSLSYLIHQVYREATDFHDQYVVSYLNKYKDPDFHFNFTVGNWSDMGVAQWAGGFITQAIVKVRSTNMVVRDGMWRIGKDIYYDNLMEYSSWAVLQGYPQAWIYSVDDARTLLHALARRDATGVALRSHIVRQGTTFFGEGKIIAGGVGALGDVTFTQEANANSFICDGDNEEACRLLNIFYNSSAALCTEIEGLYDTCLNQYNFQNNKCTNLL